MPMLILYLESNGILFLFQEILANDNIKLDWFFRASFAQDIAMVTETCYCIILETVKSLCSLIVGE